MMRISISPTGPMLVQNGELSNPRPAKPKSETYSVFQPSMSFIVETDQGEIRGTVGDVIVLAQDGTMFVMDPVTFANKFYFVS